MHWKSSSIVGLASLLGAATSAWALPTVQTFDGGGTPFTAVQHNAAPPSSVVAGGPTGSFLRVATDGIANQQNTVAFDRTHTGAFKDRLHMSFDVRFSGTGDTADGMGVALLNTANFGVSGGLVSFFNEDPNLVNSFGIGLDVHDNGAGDVSQDSITLHFNNAQVAQADLTGLLDLENGLFNGVNVWITPVAGGSNVTMTITPDSLGTPGTTLNVFNDFFIAGLFPYESRVAFSGRTGGLNGNHDIDNLRVTFVVPEPASVVTLAMAGVGLLVRRRRMA